MTVLIYVDTSKQVGDLQCAIAAGLAGAVSCLGTESLKRWIVRRR